LARTLRARSVVHRLDRRGVGQNGDDGLDLSGKLAGRTGERGTGGFERLGLLGRAVPYRERVADLDQPRRDRRAHAAEPRNPDLHRKSSIVLAGCGS